MNNTGHSSTGFATNNNKSNTRVSKEPMNSSSNNKSYGSSKYMNHSKGSVMPQKYTYEVNEEEKSMQVPRQNSPQGLRIKKEQSADATKPNRKKLKSAPRGSR